MSTPRLTATTGQTRPKSSPILAEQEPQADQDEEDTHELPHPSHYGAPPAVWGRRLPITLGRVPGRPALSRRRVALRPVVRILWILRGAYGYPPGGGPKYGSPCGGGGA